MILNTNKISVNMNMMSVIEEVCCCCIGKFGNGFTTGIPKHIYISVHDHNLPYFMGKKKSEVGIISLCIPTLVRIITSSLPLDLFASLQSNAETV
jgi:hypothetical protein